MGTSIKIDDPFNKNFLYKAKEGQQKTLTTEKPKSRDADIPSTSQSTLQPSATDSSDSTPISKPELPLNPYEDANAPSIQLTKMQHIFAQIATEAEEAQIEHLTKSKEKLIELYQKKRIKSTERRVKNQLDSEKAQKNAETYGKLAKGIEITGKAVTIALVVTNPQLAFAAKVGFALLAAEYTAYKSGLIEKSLESMGIQSKEHPELYKTVAFAASVPAELASIAAPFFSPAQATITAASFKVVEGIVKYQGDQSEAALAELEADQVNLRYENEKFGKNIKKTIEGLSGNKNLIELTKQISENEHEWSKIVSSHIMA